MQRNKDLSKNIPEKIISRRANGTVRAASIPLGESMTQQQFKEECDVNNIIKKYSKTGSITHVRNAQEGVYADLTNLPDLQEAQHVVIQARQAFEAIPAHIRQRFNHDPNLLIEFLADDKNHEEAIKLGLKVPKPSPPPPDPILSELQTLNKTLSKKPKPTSSSNS